MTTRRFDCATYSCIDSPVHTGCDFIAGTSGDFRIRIQAEKNRALVVRTRLMSQQRLGFACPWGSCTEYITAAVAISECTQPPNLFAYIGTATPLHRQQGHSELQGCLCLHKASTWVHKQFNLVMGTSLFEIIKGQEGGQKGNFTVE